MSSHALINAISSGLVHFCRGPYFQMFSFVFPFAFALVSGLVVVSGLILVSAMIVVFAVVGFPE